MLWRPALFGAKPQLVLKAGFPAWGAVGDPNAATDAREPLVLGPQFGAHGGGAAAELSVAFVAQRLAGDRRTRTRCRPASGGSPSPACRGIGAADMVRNDRLGAVRVDPATHAVTLDGEPVNSAPADSVTLSRLYLLG